MLLSFLQLCELVSNGNAIVNADDIMSLYEQVGLDDPQVEIAVQEVENPIQIYECPLGPPENFNDVEYVLESLCAAAFVCDRDDLNLNRDDANLNRNDGNLVGNSAACEIALKLYLSKMTEHCSSVEEPIGWTRIWLRACCCACQTGRFGPLEILLNFKERMDGYTNPWMCTETQGRDIYWMLIGMFHTIPNTRTTHSQRVLDIVYETFSFSFPRFVLNRN